MSTLPTPRPFTVALVYGTRPEAIKMAPLVRAFTNDPRFRPMVVVTGQHREMLDQVHRVFDITPDVDLDIHAPGHTLTEITTRSLNGIGAVLQADEVAGVLEILRPVRPDRPALVKRPAQGPYGRRTSSTSTFAPALRLTRPR